MLRKMLCGLTLAVMCVGLSVPARAGGIGDVFKNWEQHTRKTLAKREKSFRASLAGLAG